MARLSLFVLVLAVSAIAGGCHSGVISVAGVGQRIAADDGFQLTVFSFEQTPARSAPPRGIVLYIQGSEDHSVTESVDALAAFCAMNAPVIAFERRGVTPDGRVDAEIALRSATRERRVRDALTALEWGTRDVAPGTPVLLLGASEGADVASAVAARAPHVSCVILLGGGGGWTQEEEFRHFIRARPGYMGLADESELDARVADIKAHPDADTMWAGHPYRRWSTFMFSRPADDLLRVNCPIVVVQGDRDDAVPIESARSLRDAFQLAGKTNFTLIEIPGVDHRFMDAATGVSKLPLVEVEVVQWLTTRGVLDAAESRVFLDRVRKAHPEAF
jgi:pimeloyl-ACP methyl ester carboxylesterase